MRASSKLLQIQKQANSTATRLGTYINQLKTMPPNSDARVRWEIFQRDLRPGRERIKYENLLIKSNYITTAEAEREYHIQTDVAETKYLFVPFYAVSDSAVTVTEDDLKAYYNKNIERYKTEESRDIKYISIPVEPSSDDSVAVHDELSPVCYRTSDYTGRFNLCCCEFGRTRSIFKIYSVYAAFVY